MQHLWFQSTLPRRERHQHRSKAHPHQPFQSTLPRRERHARTSHKQSSKPVSIHAPAKGATYLTLGLFAEVGVSIHAPAKGATSLIYLKVFTSRGFQSTLPRRERRMVRLIPNILRAFQSTLPRRERHTMKSNCRLSIHVSIHAPAKGATRLFIILADR